MATDLLGWAKEAASHIESPMDIRRRKAQEAEARELERMKVGSEAFYKQQLGLSEKAKREKEGQGDAQLQQAIAGAPNLQEFIKPGTHDPQAIKDGMARWNQANQQYWMENYPQYAEDMTKGTADLTRQVQSPDPSTEQRKVEADTYKAESEGRYYSAGGPAQGAKIEVSESELQIARSYLKKIGRTSWTGAPSDTGEVHALAVRAKQLWAADSRNLGKTQSPDYYMGKAAQELFQTQPQAPQSQPQAPVAGNAAPAVGGDGRRKINLQNMR